MINEYDKVRIKETGVTGEVIDISETNGKKSYIVESDEKGVPGGWWEADPNSWSLFTCTEEELEKL